MSSEGDDILIPFFLKLFRHWAIILEQWASVVKNPGIRESLMELRGKVLETIHDIELKRMGLRKDGVACGL